MIELAYRYNSPNRNKGRLDYKITKIVIHHTQTDSFMSVYWTFLDPKEEKSAHYVVDKDGSIYQFVNECDTAWHCGVKGHWFNQQAIGIEIVQRDPALFTEEQYQSVAEIIIDCCQRYNLLIEFPCDDRWMGYENAEKFNGILGHSNISKTKFDCPGENFNWDKLRAVIFERTMHQIYEKGGKYGHEL